MPSTNLANSELSYAQCGNKNAGYSRFYVGRKWIFACERVTFGNATSILKTEAADYSDTQVSYVAFVLRSATVLQLIFFDLMNFAFANLNSLDTDRCGILQAAESTKRRRLTSNAGCSIQGPYSRSRGSGATPVIDFGSRSVHAAFLGD
jgi:hypothetical protein